MKWKINAFWFIISWEEFSWGYDKNSSFFILSEENLELQQIKAFVLYLFDCFGIFSFRKICSEPKILLLNTLKYCELFQDTK